MELGGEGYIAGPATKKKKKKSERLVVFLGPRAAFFASSDVIIGALVEIAIPNPLQL